MTLNWGFILSEENGPDEVEYTPEYYDEVWRDDMKPETEDFLFKVFYPFIGFHPKAKSNRAWRKNLKILLDWGTIEWNDNDNCVRLLDEHAPGVVSLMRRTMTLPKEYENKRDEFFSHFDELLESRICGYSIIFPLGTENRLWTWLDEYTEVEDKEDFENLTKEILLEYGPLPYVSVMISRNSAAKIDEAISEKKTWRDTSDFIEEAIEDKMQEHKKG